MVAPTPMLAIMIQRRGLMMEVATFCASIAKKALVWDEVSRQDRRHPADINLTVASAQ